MSVLDHLIAAPGVYWGEGHGPGGGPFVARVALVVEDDASLVFDYEAWSAQGGLHHAESARMARSGDGVLLAATSNGGDDTMLFREGDPGVFGSIGEQRVGLVIDAGDHLTFSWWWTGRDGVLREQSRASLAPMRQIVPPPGVPSPSEGHGSPDTPASPASPASPDAPAASAEDDADETGQGADATDDVTTEADGPTDAPGGDGEPDGAPDDAPDADLAEPTADEADATDAPDVAAAAVADPTTVPWPGILVLNGPSTGIVAQRLAARLTRAAVVRTDLFDRAVRGTAGRPDPALRQRIALSVVQGYAATGHPVILHGASSRAEHEALAAAISRTGLSPVKLVDVADGEDYGEVARRLIEND